MNSRRRMYISGGKERGERLSAPARDVTALTTPGRPQWPFLEGADALTPRYLPLPSPPRAPHLSLGDWRDKLY